MKTTNFGTRLMLENENAIVTPLPGQTFYIGLSTAIREAKYKIDVIQYQWNFYPGKPDNPVQKLNQLLISQIRKGVKCRIILNKEGRGQHLTAINMKASQYLTEAGARIKFGKTFPITHAKLWLIDDQLSILGSHNLSGRSFTVNNEVSIQINNNSVNREYQRYFEQLWQRL